MVASVVLGAVQFGTHRLPQGMAGALVIASVATVIEGLVVDRYRSLVPPLTFALYAVVIAISARTDAAGSMSNDSQLLTLLATTIVGAMLVMIPTFAIAVRDASLRPEQDRPRRSRGRSRRR
jgi:hypothetical protein